MGKYRTILHSLSVIMQWPGAVLDLLHAYFYCGILSHRRTPVRAFPITRPQYILVQGLQCAILSGSKPGNVPVLDALRR